jgi:hypothetical protein
MLGNYGVLMNSRRKFFRLVALSGAGVFVAGETFAVDAPVLDEKDPQAIALGYIADATKANKVKYPNYAAGQMCSGCQFYQGKAGAAMGPCPLYGGKQVAAKGWCSAYAKKAG